MCYRLTSFTPIIAGFMLLAGRLREESDEHVVLDVIQKYFRRRVRPCQLFGQDGGLGSLASHDCLQLLRSPLSREFNHLVWTADLLRMAVLAYRAISFDEAVLLVGNTGLVVYFIFVHIWFSFIGVKCVVQVW